MCGVFGVARLDRGPAINKDRARSATKALDYRGPDAVGEHCNDSVFMGHTRLSIQDLSPNGAQPMVHEESNDFCAVNGEVYNHHYIREKLGKHLFQSNSDAEAVLRACSTWGIKRALTELDGMYAFSHYSVEHNEIYLVVDRVGIKPIFYAETEKGLIWASELGALRRYDPSLFLDTDVTALYDFLTYRYIPSPKTAYSKIRKLPPGHVLTYSLGTGRFSICRYWTLPVEESFGGGFIDARDQLRALVKISVETHMQGDVEVGTFLSGGVDSTIITSQALKFSSDMRTFCIGFEEVSHDETPFAKMTAERYGLSLIHKVVTPLDAKDVYGWMLDLYGEPFGDYSAVPTYGVSSLARESVKVCLSGDGGDELFGGYPWYSRLARQRHRIALPGRLTAGYSKKHKGSLCRRALNRLSMRFEGNLFEYYVRLMNGTPHADRLPLKQQLEIPADYDDYWNLRRYWRPELGPEKAWRYLDFHTYLADDILVKVDRASMRNSLEVRVPFLGTELVEFAFSLRDSVMLAAGPKGLLKAAFEDVLPPEIIARQKKGFGIPVAAWGLVRAGQDTFEENMLSEFRSRYEAHSK